jgi:hypothetical protein
MNYLFTTFRIIRIYCRIVLKPQKQNQPKLLLAFSGSFTFFDRDAPASRFTKVKIVTLVSLL